MQRSEKKQRKRMLDDNKQCRDNRARCGEQFHDKKERSRKLNKTVIKNAVLILSNVLRKIPESITVNNPKNVGMVVTVAKASEDRKISCNTTFTNTTKQSATTFTKVFDFKYFECSAAMVSHN